MKFLMVPALVTVVFLLYGVSGVEIGSLPNLQHGVSGTLHILDENTIYIEDFNYDGGGPGTWFYYYLPGVPASSTSGAGHKIPLSTEFGKSDGSLKSVTYTDVDITATLPDGVDACDIGTFTVWCEPFTVFFSTIVIPMDIFVNNGVGDDCALVSDTTVTPAPPEFDNCAVLSDKLQVSWRVHTDTEHMRFRLCGCQSIVSSTNQYMGFGVSGANNVTQMLGADPTIAWVDPMDGAQAVDYYLSAYTQCREGKGACPDTLDSSGSCTNDVFNVEGSVEDGVQCVSFTRNYSTSDSVCDKAINPSDANQYIVWAVGGYGETAFKHFVNAQSTTSPIHLGRTPADNCTGINLNCPSCSPFVNQQIIAREDTVFEVTVGPSGNERGYMGITGRAGWGISFFVNGTMIPELTVERGRTYKFLIRGGTDPNNHPNYHPLYISNSIGGGRLANTAAEQANETVYAGINGNGEATAVGDLCQLSESGSSQSTRESCSSDLEDYINTLTMSDGCESGEPGELIWTPNDTTPDLVYYQCAIHLNLGWKINVEDNSATDPPPTGSTPGSTSDSTPDPTPDSTPEPPPDNCVVFSDQLQLSWKVNQTFSNIRFKLCGCHSRTSEYNQYMAFGMSGSPLSVEMLGGDVTLAWVDATKGPQAFDYYLSGRLPCNSQGSGVCPDTLDSTGSCTNDVFNVEGSVEDGVQCVSFTRKLTTSDSNCDTGINPDEVIQYVIWAIGKYQDGQAQYHSTMRSKGTNSRIHFGRTPSDECAGIDIKCQSCSTFMNKKIIASDGDASFEVTVGPSAKERGYAGITGLEGGDVAFYINGSLIPELTLQRGNSYTFLVNGGYDSSNPSQYYRFYITDSTSGGSSANGESFAMIDVNSNADGSLCELLESTSSAYVRESCSSLESYISTLMKSDSCTSSSSRPVMVTWTPDNDTPDLVYYQSTNHQYMGWRINIVGDSTMGSSAQSGQKVVCSFLLIILIASVVLLLV